MIWGHPIKSWNPKYVFRRSQNKSSKDQSLWKPFWLLFNNAMLSRHFSQLFLFLFLVFFCFFFWWPCSELAPNRHGTNHTLQDQMGSQSKQIQAWFWRNHTQGLNTRILDKLGRNFPSRWRGWFCFHLCPHPRGWWQRFGRAVMNLAPSPHSWEPFARRDQSLCPAEPSACWERSMVPKTSPPIRALTPSCLSRLRLSIANGQWVGIFCHQKKYFIFQNF